MRWVKFLCSSTDYRLYSDCHKLILCIEMGHVLKKKFEQLKELKFEHEVREIHLAQAIV